MSTSYNTRLQMKTDTEANWDKATNFVPLKGELCFYSDLNMIKIGDGETLINDLRFVQHEIDEKPVVVINITGSSSNGYQSTHWFNDVKSLVTQGYYCIAQYNNLFYALQEIVDTDYEKRAYFLCHDIDSIERTIYLGINSLAVSYRYLQRQITGNSSQVVGFNSSGKVTPIDISSIMPASTSEDEGKFLMVVDGVPAWTSVPRAEEASF